ncbi:MAG: hypothetical protein LBG06_11915 [Deltaproteobacteria bacterium]|jgi:hypothetical protein|nr:hypothetical protein [Deltaproteobacteria bacterium]
MPHDGFVAGVVARIARSPGRGPDGLPAGPLERSREPKLLVCLDLVLDPVEDGAERFRDGGREVVEVKSPPPYHLVFRGGWAEGLSRGGLAVGDLLGARFTYVPWDPATLSEIARLLPPWRIPILGEGESPVVFMRAGEAPDQAAAAPAGAAHAAAAPSLSVPAAPSPSVPAAARQAAAAPPGPLRARPMRPVRGGGRGAGRVGR